MIAGTKTARGRATRERIVTAASRLISERGVAETSVDDVIELADASKSQLYHYFGDRAGLLRAVVAHNADAVVGELPALDSWKAIRSWFDSLVDLQVERRACGGCPIGSLVGQLAESDPKARLALADSFQRWREHLQRGLESMQQAGKVASTADAHRLAAATLATIQGGLILTQAKRDPTQLRIALDAAYEQLRSSRPG